MKRITVVLIVAILLIAIVLLADTVMFNEEPDAGASNIQGKVYIWDEELNEYVLVGPGQTVYVYLYYDDLHGGGLYDSGIDVTDEFSFYSYDFLNSGGNCNYCDLVKVSFLGRLYEEEYDGIVRIDIYWTPIPPEQTPGEE